MGQTRRPLSVRLAAHLRPRKNCNFHAARLFRSCVRVGRPVRIQLLQRFVGSQQDFDDAERYWIKTFRDAGCRLVNSAPGGIGGLVRSGFRMSDLHRQKVSDSRKGFRVAEATKAKISGSLTGRSNWMPAGFWERQSRRMQGNTYGHRNRGRITSLETKEKLSKIKSKPIIDQNGIVYPSQTAAAVILDLHQAAIGRVLAGTQKQTGGYFFQFVR